MRVLVLSGGGLFGAWQAGAWSVASRYFQPDLIVGASIGAVNGYLLAADVAPGELEEMWRDPKFSDRHNLHDVLQQITSRFPLRRSLAISVTDLLQMKGVIYRDREITWRHLAASCAIPLVLPQMKLNGRWSSDGGLLRPLPLWAAVELGATEVLGLNVLAEFPSKVLQPVVQTFRFLFAPRLQVPEGVQVRTLVPSQRLGGLLDTLSRSQENVDRWLQLGRQDAAAAFADAGASVP